MKARYARCSSPPYQRRRPLTAAVMADTFEVKSAMAAFSAVLLPAVVTAGGQRHRGVHLAGGTCGVRLRHHRASQAGPWEEACACK